jgi:membrane fusion protein (multidrug efflux system)
MRGITRRKCSRPQRKIAQANACIANFEAQIAAQEAAIKQADKQVAEADVALKFSNQENDRCQDLVSTGAGTAQRAQQASSDLQQKQPALDAAAAAADAAKKQVAVLDAQRDNAALSALQLTERRTSHALI